MSQFTEISKMGKGFKTYIFLYIIVIAINLFISIPLIGLIPIVIGFGIIIYSINQCNETIQDNFLNQTRNLFIWLLIVELVFSFINFGFYIDDNSYFLFLILIDLVILYIMMFIEGIILIFIGNALKSFSYHSLNDPTLANEADKIKTGGILMLIPIIGVIGWIVFLVGIYNVGDKMEKIESRQRMPNQYYSQGQNVQPLYEPQPAYQPQSNNIEPSSMKKFCTHCGTPAKPNDTFCGSCGEKLR